MCPACTPNVPRLPPHVPLQVVLRFRREADESDDAPRSSPLFHVFSTEYKVPCTALPTSTQPQPGPNPAPTRPQSSPDPGLDLSPRLTPDPG